MIIWPSCRDGHAQEDDRVAPDARTWVSISRLTLPVSKLDDGEVIRCSAEHPTLEAPISDSVRLSIHCECKLSLPIVHHLLMILKHY